jgi:hypothetical protein
MNNNYSFFAGIGWVLFGFAVLICGCRDDAMPSRKDVSDQPEHLKGLKVDAEYTLQGDVFYRVYQEKASLHPPNSVWCVFTIEDYTRGLVTNKYVKAVLPQGTRLRFEKALVNDLSTHTVILYYAVVLGGAHQGQEVLINSLVDDQATWLAEDGYQVESESKERPSGGGPSITMP